MYCFENIHSCCAAELPLRSQKADHRCLAAHSSMRGKRGEKHAVQVPKMQRPGPRKQRPLMPIRNQPLASRRVISSPVILDHMAAAIAVFVHASHDQLPLYIPTWQAQTSPPAQCRLPATLCIQACSQSAPQAHDQRAEMNVVVCLLQKQGRREASAAPTSVPADDSQTTCALSGMAAAACPPGVWHI